MKKIMAVILAVMLCITSTAIADIQWEDMTDVEIYALIQAAREELARRNREPEIAPNKPLAIKTEYGDYTVTVEGVHVYGSVPERSRPDFYVPCMITVHATVENISYTRFDEPLSNYYIQQEMIVLDEKGYELSSFDVNTGDDGEYEVGASIEPGAQKKVSLLYSASMDTENVFVTFKGYQGMLHLAVVELALPKK